MKQMPMMPSTGRGAGGKVLGTVVMLVVLGLVITNPVGAAHAAHGVFAWLGHVLDSFSQFGSAVSR
ncbi:hypothetical protein [Kutzneria sp. NPDC051319]|uniref:hypothetical protein n=1 Tax=Kutzneria sp. NPDC051319 TaxID=3155047 RepID=UPI00341AE4BE